METIQRLSKAQQAKAVVVFGKPLNSPFQKFTGGDIQAYLKIRRDFVATLKAKGAFYLVDYKQYQFQVDANYLGVNPVLPGYAAGALPPPIVVEAHPVGSYISAPLPDDYDYGIAGENIVEAVCPYSPPPFDAVVNAEIQRQVNIETARFQAQRARIRAARLRNDITPVQRRNMLREARGKQDDNLAKIRSTVRRSLEKDFTAMTRARLEVEKGFNDLRLFVIETFRKMFAGPALTFIDPGMENGIFKRCLWSLDQRYALNATSRSAIDILQREFKSFKFSDDMNLSLQLERFVQTLTQLDLVGFPVADGEKQVRLLSALSNGGVVEEAFRSQINYLSNPDQHHIDINFDEMLRRIQTRLSNLIAESNVLQPHSEPAAKKQRAYFTSQEEDLEEAHNMWEAANEEDTGDEQAFYAKPSGPSAKPSMAANPQKSKITCHNCGKQGHLAKDCFKLKTCTYCGKKGHIEAHCRQKKSDSKKQKEDDVDPDALSPQFNKKHPATTQKKSK
jgi:hypothetical protein